MIFNTKQINELIHLIDNLHWLFIGDKLGTKFIPSSVLKELKVFGIKDTQVNSYPNYAFQYGLLAVALKDKRVKKFNFEQLKKFIVSGQWLPLTKQENYGLEMIENRLVDGIKGLGNKVSSDFKTILIESDLKQRKEFEKVIKEKSEDIFSQRGGVKSLVSELGHKTGDWARDFGRISQFVLHEAFDNGRAYGILRKYGSESKVFKRVYTGACTICNNLYTTYNRKEGKYIPKIFPLSELIANGTNVGRKQADWLPVVGATHPWCRCDLEEVPTGYEWDFKKQRFDNTGLTDREKMLEEKYHLKRFLKVEIIP